METLWLELLSTKASIIPLRVTSTWSLTRVSRAPPDPATTTSSGMTQTSLLTRLRPLPTIFATCTADAPGKHKILLLRSLINYSRSVSYPTPTYYSHLVADRARRHYSELAGNECGGSSSGSAGSVRLTEAEKRKIQVIIEKGVEKPMYFV